MITESAHLKTDEFYGELPGFVEYFGDFLQSWAKSLSRLFELKLGDFSSQDRERLIFLLIIDSVALEFAMEKGIHPITGLDWDKEDRIDQERCRILQNRNESMINRLKKEIENKKD